MEAAPLAPDLCIVGDNPAGLALAECAAAQGLSVILVRADARRHGDPATLVACFAGAARRACDTGDVRAALPDARAAMQRLALNTSDARLAGLGVRVLRGDARFRDRRALSVGAIMVRARHFAIAVSAEPRAARVAGLETVPFMTLWTLPTLARLPKSVVILGATAAGLALAQAFLLLGSAVTVVDPGPALSGFEPEMTALLVARLRSDGLTIRDGVAVERVARRGRNLVRLTLAPGPDRIVDGALLVVVPPLVPDLGALGLAAAGVAAGPDGIRTSAHGVTRNRRIFALGEAASGRSSAPGAEAEAVLAMLTRRGVRRSSCAAVRIVHTEPGLAEAGLSDAEARRRHRGLRTLRFPFAETVAGQADHDSFGHVRLLVTKEGILVGASILGRQAADLIAAPSLAIAEALPIRALAALPLSEELRGEALRRAAASFDIPQPAIGWRRKLSWLVHRR